VWVHPAIDGGEAEPVEGGAERPSPGGTCLKKRIKLLLVKIITEILSEDYNF